MLCARCPSPFIAARTHIHMYMYIYIPYPGTPGWLACQMLLQSSLLPTGLITIFQRDPTVDGGVQQTIPRSF